MVSSVIKNPASFFLYRLYLWADKRLYFFFPPLKAFASSGTENLERFSAQTTSPHVLFIRIGSQADARVTPGQGDGATSLVPTKQDLRLQLGERWASLGSQSQGREKGAGVG